MLEGKIKANWECIEVTACRTKANRFFHVRCKQCNQYSYGQFGTWAVWWSCCSMHYQGAAAPARETDHAATGGRPGPCASTDDSLKDYEGLTKWRGARGT